MRNMGNVVSSRDPNWPSAATLLYDHPLEGRRNVGLLGISTYATSGTERSATSTPAAIRSALERYSTWSFTEMVDLAESVALVDFGDVDAPDAEGGAQRVAEAMSGWDPSIALRLILGGDNAATWHALRALSGGEYSNFGLVTLDAHLDMRDGVSNGSPVRQLLEEGFDGHHVVLVGLADFSNSPAYARRAFAGATTAGRGLRRASRRSGRTRRLLEFAGLRAARPRRGRDPDLARCPAPRIGRRGGPSSRRDRRRRKSTRLR